MKNVIKTGLLLTTILFTGFGCQVSKIDSVPTTTSFKVVNGSVTKWNKKPSNDQNQKIENSSTRVVEGNVIDLAKK